MSTMPETPWAPFPRSTEVPRRLVCFPCAGQGASVYQSWQQILAPDVDVVPIQLPGREGRATAAPHTDMDALLADLLPVLREQVTGPYTLFGHSMGAAVAFEVACQAEAEGWAPERLIVAAQRPPDEPQQEPLIHDLPHAAFMTMLGLYGQVPVEIFDDPAAVDLAATTLRADFTLIETYLGAAGPRLSCPVTALAGLGDSSVPPRTVRGWERVTRGPFTFRPLPGDHFFVHERTDEVTGLIRATVEAAGE